MTRFYFDVHDGADYLPDEDGLEFDRIETAEHEAVKAAAAIAKDCLPTGDAREVTVKVRDGKKGFVTVTISMQIDRSEASALAREG